MTGSPLRGRPILLITRMITDRIGLQSVLLPLLILEKVHRKIVSVNFNGMNSTNRKIKIALAGVQVVSAIVSKDFSMGIAA